MQRLGNTAILLLAAACAQPAQEPRLSSAPTFHEHIEPILQARCQICHHRGGNAPFTLEDFASARNKSRTIRKVVTERLMPPWGAGPEHGRFRNDPSLTAAEIDSVARWVDAGAPEGEPTRATPPRRFPERWDIGNPDATFTTSAFDVPPEGRLPYRYARISTDFAEDRWVEAAQVRSTAPETVHHVLVFLEGGRPAAPGVKRPWRPRFNPMRLLQGAPRKDHPMWIARYADLIARDLRVGTAGGLDGYFMASSSGNIPVVFPEGQAKLLPAGATFVLQIHYTPSGRAQTSQTTLALRFARQPPQQAVDTGAIATVTFKIPPGAPAHEAEAFLRLPRDALLVSMSPHMHVRGKAFRYAAEFPDGQREILLEVPRYDFNWQLEYILAEPRLLPRGTVLRAIATYDNSPSNPQNPDPSKEVYFGIQTEEEMLIGYYSVVWAD